jgi:hypothetical protein
MIGVLMVLSRLALVVRILVEVIVDDPMMNKFG